MILKIPLANRACKQRRVDRAAAERQSLAGKDSCSQSWDRGIDEL